MSAQLLIADCDPGWQQRLSACFENEGYAVGVVATGLDALSCIYQGRIDLAVVELELPDISGIDVCRRVRTNPTLAHVPILIWSARAREADRIAGFQAGADDYVSKLVSLRELCLRVRAVLRRRPSAAQRCFDRGGVYLNLDAHRCQVDGSEVQLTVREFELLRVLLEHPGREHSREDLLYEVWGTDARAGLRTVDAHISRLRGKLGSPGMWIQTVRGSGYRFVTTTSGSTSGASGSDPPLRSATTRGRRQARRDHPGDDDEPEAPLASTEPHANGTLSVAG